MSQQRFWTGWTFLPTQFWHVWVFISFWWQIEGQMYDRTYATVTELYTEQWSWQYGTNHWLLICIFHQCQCLQQTHAHLWSSLCEKSWHVALTSDTMYLLWNGPANTENIVWVFFTSWSHFQKGETGLLEPGRGGLERNSYEPVLHCSLQTAEGSEWIEVSWHHVYM